MVTPLGGTIGITFLCWMHCTCACLDGRQLEVYEVLFFFLFHSFKKKFSPFFFLFFFLYFKWSFIWQASIWQINNKLTPYGSYSHSRTPAHTLYGVTHSLLLACMHCIESNRDNPPIYEGETPSKCLRIFFLFWFWKGPSYLHTHTHTFTCRYSSNHLSIYASIYIWQVGKQSFSSSMLVSEWVSAMSFV